MQDVRVDGGGEMWGQNGKDGFWADMLLCARVLTVDSVDAGTFAKSIMPLSNIRHAAITACSSEFLTGPLLFGAC